MSQVRWEPILMCVCGSGTRTGGTSFGLYMKVLVCSCEIADLVCCRGLYFREGFVQYPVGLKGDERKGSAGDKRGGHTRPFWLEHPYPAAMSSDCHRYTHTYIHSTSVISLCLYKLPNL